MGIEIIYSAGYDIGVFGLERLHPFDSHKPSKAYRRIAATLAGRRGVTCRQPSAKDAITLLDRIHTPEYLASLAEPAAVARALEMGIVRALPRRLVTRLILEPMAMATAGTALAARRALSVGSAINLSGGYHHAHRDHGEGFCLYSDVPAAIESLRATGELGADDGVAIIDLDAHRGNGFESFYAEDRTIQFLDIHNAQAYPGPLRDRDRFASVVGIRAGMGDDGYFNVLRIELGPFMERVRNSRLAFYNAGTDILTGDPVGRLAVTRDGVLERDRIVIEALTAANIPWVMLPSGGYTRESHRLLAETAVYAIEASLGSVSPTTPSVPSRHRRRE